MAINRASGLIQESPEKCELQSGKRKTPSFSQNFHEIETWDFSSTACVCTQVFYCADCLCTQADPKHGMHTSVSFQKIKIPGSLTGKEQLVCTLEVTIFP